MKKILLPRPTQVLQIFFQSTSLSNSVVNCSLIAMTIHFPRLYFYDVHYSFSLTCRSVDNKRLMDFFKNDFSVERWRKAALKNAFDLLGKQRFDHAAAFFLLAGSLHDAVEVKQCSECIFSLSQFF